MKTLTYTLPAYWASYLINGDGSGLEPGEQETIDAFLAREALDFPVDCTEEARFNRYNDAHTGLAGDVLDYTFLANPEVAKPGGRTPLHTGPRGPRRRGRPSTPTQSLSL